MTTTSDARYGRRGGRWLPDKPARTTKAPAKVSTGSCEACGHRCHWDGRWPAPVCCGRLLCRARLTWPTERWAGQADCAQARQHTRQPLTALDRQALDLARELP